MGEPADRRSTAEHYDEIYVYGCEAVHGDFAIAAFGTSRASASLLHRDTVGESRSARAEDPLFARLSLPGHHIAEVRIN